MLISLISYIYNRFYKIKPETTGSCVLNKASRISHPEMFTKTGLEDSSVVYMDLVCDLSEHLE